LSASLIALLLGGCGMLPEKKHPRLASEAFDSSSTYSRSYDHSPSQTCEAARRALLSQGFVVGRAEGDVVEARKYFQPRDESHEQVEFRAVCMPQLRGEQQTVVFVNAVQDRYALRKSNTSASLGVSALGSLSLPIGSTDDSLVKVASETVQEEAFYKRFFAVLSRFLPETVETPPAPAAAATQPVLFPLFQYQQPTPAEPVPAGPAEQAPMTQGTLPPQAAPAQTEPAAEPVPLQGQ